MEHKIHIIIGVLGGCVDDIKATLDDAVAEALYQQFCQAYSYDPEHAGSCKNDVGTITVTIDVTPTTQQPVKVYELED